MGSVTTRSGRLRWCGGGARTLAGVAAAVAVLVCALWTPVGAVYVARGTEEGLGDDPDDVVPYAQYTGLAGRLRPVDLSDDTHAALRQTLAEALARGHAYRAEDVELLRVEQAALAYRVPGLSRAQRAALRRMPFATAYEVTAVVGPAAAREQVRAELLTDNHGHTMVTAYYSGDEEDDDEEGTTTTENGGESKENEDKKEGGEQGGEEEEGRAFRVATYNVWNYNGDWKRRLRLLGRELCSRAHDAVVVQEVRYGRWRDEALARNGWNWTLGRAQAEHIARECARRGVAVQYVWQPAMTYVDHYARAREYEIEGVAVLTRHRLVRRAARFLARDAADPADAHQRVALAALVAVPQVADTVPGPTAPSQSQSQSLRMAVVATHWSLSPRMAVRNAVEAGALADAVRRGWGAAGVVLAGDLNAEPDSAAVRALAAPAPGPALRDAWAATRAGDAAPAVRAQLDAGTRANTAGLTWCRVPGGTNVKRCDYIFYRAAQGRTLTPFLFAVPPAAPCARRPVAGARICASDHSPLSVSFLVGRAPDAPAPDAAPEAPEAPADSATHDKVEL